MHIHFGKNIIQGDALTLMTVDDNPLPIIFSEWSFSTGSLVKRRDFIFSSLFPNVDEFRQDLFSNPVLVSDLGEKLLFLRKSRNINQFIS